MAQRQNTFAALLAALTLLPQFVHSAQQTDQTNEQKHSNVSNAILAVAQIGGAIASAQNPLYGALIDAAIKAAVASAQATNFAPPAPIAMVPVETLPPDHPVVVAQVPVPPAAGTVSGFTP